MTWKPAAADQRIGDRADHVRVLDREPGAVLADAVTVDGHGVLVDEAGLHQLVDDAGYAAGAVELLAEVLARGLHVDQQRDVVAVGLPVLDRQLDPGVPGDGDHVRRRVGRAADGRGHADRVLECLPDEDRRGAAIVVHHLHDLAARLVGHHAAALIGSRDGRAAGQAHAERLGDRVHRRGGAHGVAVPDRRRGGRHDVPVLLLADLAGRELLARL